MPIIGNTECPKIYRKSVLHMIKYRFAVYLSRSVQICGKFLDTQYIHIADIPYFEIVAPFSRHSIIMDLCPI